MVSSRKATRPRFYFSFRSPYSWLAYRDLLTHHRAVAEQLDWRPFWEPDELSTRMLTEAGGEFPYVENSKPKARYLLQDVRRLTEQRGLSMTWPVDRAPCWEVAHLAYLVARSQGHGPQFIDAVYRARWEHGRDISDRTTIAEIAAGLGLDPGLADALDDAAVRAEGLAALMSIYRDGVFGVPMFIVGYDRYWGVDRLPTFLAALARQPELLADAPEAPPTGPVDETAEQRQVGDELAYAGPGGDQGHAGGCG